jgi:putative peptidoglycan lipid II flippase
VIGSALQFGVQIPAVLRLTGGIRPVLALANEHVRTVVRNFLPVLVSRGIVQISAFVDAMMASWLPTGSVNALTYAQSLYTLPVSLFGCPSPSSSSHDVARARPTRKRSRALCASGSMRG